MANPIYWRIIICDSTEVAARMVAAAEAELQPRYLERFTASVAEAERGWFDQQVGGLSRSPENIAAELIRAGFLTDDIHLTVELTDEERNRGRLPNKPRTQDWRNAVMSFYKVWEIKENI